MRAKTLGNRSISSSWKIRSTEKCSGFFYCLLRKGPVVHFAHDRDTETGYSLRSRRDECGACPEGTEGRTTGIIRPGGTSCPTGILRSVFSVVAASHTGLRSGAKLPSGRARSSHSSAPKQDNPCYYTTIIIPFQYSEHRRSHEIILDQEIHVSPQVGLPKDRRSGRPCGPAPPLSAAGLHRQELRDGLHHPAVLLQG